MPNISGVALLAGATLDSTAAAAGVLSTPSLQAGSGYEAIAVRMMTVKADRLPGC